MRGVGCEYETCLYRSQPVANQLLSQYTAHSGARPLVKAFRESSMVYGKFEYLNSVEKHKCSKLGTYPLDIRTRTLFDLAVNFYFVLSGCLTMKAPKQSMRINYRVITIRIIAKNRRINWF